MLTTEARLRRIEDFVDGVIHACALVLSVLGLLFLSEHSPDNGDVLQAASPSLFGVTMLLLYAASAMNLHSQGRRSRHIFQAIDHCAIFLLIAGTYSPVTLLALRGDAGWGLFVTIWMLAVFGILLRVFWSRCFFRCSLALYLGTGWIGALWAEEIGTWLGDGATSWLLAGGIAYTVGAVIFASRLPFNTAIWHLFVVAGSACHFWAVAFHILPAVA